MAAAVTQFMDSVYVGQGTLDHAVTQVCHYHQHTTGRLAQVDDVYMIHLQAAQNDLENDTNKRSSVNSEN